MPDEEGAGTAAALWDASDVALTSRITYPEGRAALASAHRARRLTARALDRARDALDTTFQRLAVVELDRSIAELAGDVADRFSLRAYDGCTWRRPWRSKTEALVMLTWDGRLAAAARRAELEVVP